MSRFFARNEHPAERVARIVVGVGLIAFAFAGPLAPWGYIGVVPLLTGIAGTCPLYSLLGFSTCRVTTRPSAN